MVRLMHLYVVVFPSIYLASMATKICASHRPRLMLSSKSLGRVSLMRSFVAAVSRIFSVIVEFVYQISILRFQDSTGVMTKGK